MDRPGAVRLVFKARLGDHSVCRKREAHCRERTRKRGGSQDELCKHDWRRRDDLRGVSCDLLGRIKALKGKAMKSSHHNHNSTNALKVAQQKTR